MINAVSLFILWLFVWSLLNWVPDTKQLIMGVFVAFFMTFMTVDTFGVASPSGKVKRAGFFGIVKKVFWFVCYTIVFIWECIKANIDVAWRVVHPTLPIRPGTIRVKTGLKSDAGLTFLANSITLTPGTTSVDVDKFKGYGYIHVLFLKDGAVSSDMRLPVVDKFERILKRIFD
ncbi:MAG: Na+/H+ antiporter subunit E [Candidatus Omnitrophica bacterium]|nr:Na+/H+ antiporter subunit E [Candidatus Omnitrophota bacterium]